MSSHLLPETREAVPALAAGSAQSLTGAASDGFPATIWPPHGYYPAKIPRIAPLPPYTWPHLVPGSACCKAPLLAGAALTCDARGPDLPSSNSETTPGDAQKLAEGFGAEMSTSREESWDATESSEPSRAALSV
ncbi:hypothetical protein BV25DRAFT_1920825 [Artomyces pyxidatus]|uniref:Uncharacterized protein n=1 Tax=Artomyces pyxidatus TaxID=48021 RepID=A0ACB8SLW6_9AGAM|nr:hypothetical protein BV25DRAFT_1920825 [Artomyces pyxidatus]